MLATVVKRGSINPDEERHLRILTIQSILRNNDLTTILRDVKRGKSFSLNNIDFTVGPIKPGSRHQSVELISEPDHLAFVILIPFAKGGKSAGDARSSKEARPKATKRRKK